MKEMSEEELKELVDQEIEKKIQKQNKRIEDLERQNKELRELLERNNGKDIEFEAEDVSRRQF